VLNLGELVHDRYRVIRKLGQGGMGAVFHAFDHLTGREVAIKILSVDTAQEPTFAVRFAREARVSRTLAHPNLVSVVDVGEHRGSPFMVMDYLAGETLEARMNRMPRLSHAEVLSIASQLCAALEYIHARGLIHRDVKSANIMLSADGRVTLLDLGVVRDSHEVSMTLDGFTVGTPCYMSPEQALGARHVDGRADLYSLASLTFEMLTSSLPFEDESDARRLARQLREDPPDARRFDPLLFESVAQVLSKALARDIEDRYTSAPEFLDALKLAMVLNTFVPDPEPVLEPRDEIQLLPRTKRSQSKGGRITQPQRWAFFAALGLGLGLLVGGLGWKHVHARTSPPAISA
jgi:serine/threonine-protein kinase